MRRFSGTRLIDRGTRQNESVPLNHFASKLIEFLSNSVTTTLYDIHDIDVEAR